MKAIQYEEYGGPEVLRLVEVEEPQAGPGQIRVKVVVAAVNPFDFKLRRGYMQQLIPASFPITPGSEAAGIVDEVGEGVSGVSVGDEVTGWTVTGSYAEYALLTDFAPKPASLDWETAATLPVATRTSKGALDTLDLKAGETLLVHGASSVVGAVGVQLAVARGVTVIGTASEANHDYLRSLGAIPVTYGDGLSDRVRATAPKGIDAVYDVTGYDVIGVSIELCGGTTDRIVSVGDHTAPARGVTFISAAVEFGPQLAEYARLAADGGLSVRIDQTFQLADAAKAQGLSEAGHPRGKLLLRP
ncbi:NADP-dependent oxidoreductase [Streptomyces plumbiresistens]|uniref:NADP-dependent oxidoreductase n=1 Tax=Streptomyces plumbiresistens TaxID=511811 RepID=A0ABP7SBP0_9ACTN